MKHSYIILAHGSRGVNSQAIDSSLVGQVKEKLNCENIDIAFLQHHVQTLEKTFAKAVDNGASTVFIMPLFIFPGTHLTQDIPQKVNDLRSLYPTVDVILTEGIGADSKLGDIIVDRFADAGQEIRQKDAEKEMLSRL